ncbi:MAG: methyltransferase domain-containing protein [Candidatus Bathyarchaeota archaeon]|nr:MAG: methyltransferase domain-containing protein [Candidatus Bathyarchaeota archaeon]
MKLLNKIEFYVKEYVKLKSLPFLFYRMLQALNRRIPLPSQALQGYVRITKDDKAYIRTILTFLKQYLPHMHEAHTMLADQLPWFIIGKHLLEKHVQITENTKILEAGSFAPLQTLFFRKKGASLICCDLHTDLWRIDETFYHFRCNLCYDDFGEETFDIVICTEVLEHLPCNLYMVRNKLIRCCKNHGFLLVSFPLKGKLSAPYSHEFLQENDWNTEHDHLREFTESTAIQFLTHPELKLVKKQKVYTYGYGGEILVALYKKIKISCPR